MSKIFISYRRDDSDEAAGRLSDHLVSQFGHDSVFMDVDGIEPGRDFRKVIEETLSQCDVLLGVMGRNWLDIKDENGHRRLDNESDFVRLEIASALRRDIPVIPVRVQGASLPKTDQLPPDLKDFAYRNAVELTHERWGSDVQVLVEQLRRLIAESDRCAPNAAPVPPARVGLQSPVAPVNAGQLLPATPKKHPIRSFVRWFVVGLFVLSGFGSIDTHAYGTMALSFFVVVVFVWDPLKWFAPKT
jgi:hypothetical protein